LTAAALRCEECAPGRSTFAGMAECPEDHDASSPRWPKYQAQGFMRKEIALFHRARLELRSVRRNGDTDAPIRPIAAVRAVHAIRPVRLRTSGIDFEA
jgi:hypothetical protein